MRMVSRFGLKGCTVVVVVRKILTRWKSSSMSLVHTQTVPFLSSGLRLAVIWARSGMNAVSWLARSRNERSWETLVGVGNSAMALYLLTSGLMPDCLTMWPAKVISFPNSSFLREIVIFRSRQRSRMMTALLCNSSSPNYGVIYNFLIPGEADYHAVGMAAPFPRMC